MPFVKKSQVIVTKKPRNHIQMKSQIQISEPVASMAPLGVSSRMGLDGQDPVGSSHSQLYKHPA